MISLDWINFTIDKDNQEIRDYLAIFLEDKTCQEISPGGGAHGYEMSMRGVGCLVAWGGDSQRGTLLVSLSGAVSSSLQWYGVAALVRSLIRDYGVRVRFTRLDLAVDVPGAVWRNVESVNKAVGRLQDGRIQRVTYYKGFKRTQEGSSVNDVSGFVSDGFTLYVGSRESERLLRIYEKTKETGKVTRFEYELKERYAAKVGYIMLSGGSIRDAWTMGSEKFFDLTGLVSDIYCVHEMYCFSIPKKKLRSTLTWLYTISKAIASVHESYPDHYERVIDLGREKLGLPPCGNTGVHLDHPDWMDDIIDADLSFLAWGTYRNPQKTTRGYAVPL